MVNEKLVTHGIHLQSLFSEMLARIGRSRYEIARETRIAESTLSRIASGRTVPSLGTLLTIAECYGLRLQLTIERSGSDVERSLQQADS